MKTELWVKEVEEFSIQLRHMIGKLAGSFAHQHSCLNINVWRFSKLGTAVTFAFIGISSLVDSLKNRSKSEETMKIGTLALFDAVFHFKTGHRLCEL